MTETLMLRMQDATEDHSAKEEAPQNLNILWLWQWEFALELLIILYSFDLDNFSSF